MPPEFPQAGFRGGLKHCITPLFIQSTKDKNEDANCQEDGQENRFGKRYLVLRLGEFRDEPEKVVLKGEQPRDEHGHGHHHEAPHGGTLIAFGEEFAHLELVLDSKTGDLTGYALDGEAQKAVRLTQAEIGLQLYSRDLDTTVTAKLKASENALTGEKAGDTSQFEANVPGLKGKSHFKVIVEQISIRGSEFKNTRAKFPEGNH